MNNHTQHLHYLEIYALNCKHMVSFSVAVKLFGGFTFVFLWWFCRRCSKCYQYLLYDQYAVIDCKCSHMGWKREYFNSWSIGLLTLCQIQLISIILLIDMRLTYALTLWDTFKDFTA